MNDHKDYNFDLVKKESALEPASPEKKKSKSVVYQKTNGYLCARFETIVLIF